MKEYRDRDGRGGRLTRRLVGALVLLALAAILVPTVLDFRTDYDRLITRSNIPEKPQDFRVREVPLPPPEAPLSSGQPPGLAPAEGGGVEAQAPPPSPAAWVVQVGSFSHEENARELRDRLRDKGFPAFVDRVQVAGRVVMRVRVGPEMQRAAAERLRGRLARELDLEGVVVGYD